MIPALHHISSVDIYYTGKNLVSQIYPLANKVLQTYAAFLFSFKKLHLPYLSKCIIILFVRETTVTIVLDLNLQISYLIQV